MIAGTLVLLMLTLGHSRPDASAPLPVVAPAPLQLPCRIGVPKRLMPTIQELWKSSPTFRRQCVRIGEADVIVGLRVGLAPHRARWAQAISKIVRNGNRVVYASVALRDDHSVGETLPHELEHVLEQIEGYNLALEAASGRATWIPSLGAYETERARHAGERARKELATARDPKAPHTIVAGAR